MIYRGAVPLIIVYDRFDLFTPEGMINRGAVPLIIVDDKFDLITPEGFHNYFINLWCCISKT
jgi:hypothetical protein